MSIIEVSVLMCIFEKPMSTLLNLLPHHRISIQFSSVQFTFPRCCRITCSQLVFPGMSIHVSHIYSVVSILSLSLQYIIMVMANASIQMARALDSHVGLRLAGLCSADSETEFDPRWGPFCPCESWTHNHIHWEFRFQCKHRKKTPWNSTVLFQHKMIY